MMRVAVVGGGIAGLACAAALAPRHEVTVYEAAPQRDGVGGALVMWPSAQRALAQIGALGAVEAAAAPMVPGALHHISGRPVTKPRHVDVLVVRRPDLIRALVDAVPDSVQINHREITDPEHLDADLVVGADGVRSRVRALVQPSAAVRRVTPFLVLRGELPLLFEPSQTGEYWGRGLLAGMIPLREGCYWFTAHRSDLGPEPLDVDTALEEARHRFADAAPQVQTLLAAAGAETLATRLWVAPPMRRYVRGRYVVIGDAAHAMTPNLGRGACDAIVDAVSLAAAVDQNRVPAWEARRLPLTQAARLGSAALMRTALAPMTGRLLSKVAR